MAAGKGTEDVTTYVNTELEFCNIENIHVMRSSFAAVGESSIDHIVLKLLGLAGLICLWCCR